MAVIGVGNENYVASSAIQFVQEHGFNFNLKKFIEVYAWMVLEKWIY